MKERTPEQLKGQIKSFAKKRNLQPQEVLQMYMFYNLYKDDIDYEVLKKAVKNTSEKRGSEDELREWKDICEDMRADSSLLGLWENYRNYNSYSREISYETIMDAVEEIGRRVSGTDSGN